MTHCSCGQCQCGANVFGERAAERELARYRKKGPSATTRMLLDALKAEGVEGLTLLDIGGGVGAISLELLKSGLAQATEIEASTAYVTQARSEAARQTRAASMDIRQGDFVALAGDTPSADIVTLDRVLCCYPDMPTLVGLSAAKAARLYGLVYPRDLWWVRALSTLANPLLRACRVPLRLYIHPTAMVDAAIRGAGLAQRVHRDAGYWQVAVYARPAEGA